MSSKEKKKKKRKNELTTIKVRPGILLYDFLLQSQLNLKYQRYFHSYRFSYAFHCT